MTLSLVCLTGAFIVSGAHTPTYAEVLAEPICFLVKNEAPYNVYGDVSTDYYTKPDGRQARHRSNFQLAPVGTTHETEGYPLDVAEFCSSGPFYPGRKLEVTVRTLIPLDSCRTRVDQGAVTVKGYRKKEGGTETWLECHE